MNDKSAVKNKILGLFVISIPFIAMFFYIAIVNGFNLAFKTYGATAFCVLILIVFGEAGFRIMDKKDIYDEN